MATPKAKFDITAKNKTSRAFKAVRAGMGGVMRAAFSMKAGFAAAAGVAGLGFLIKKSLDAIDKIGKMSKIFGITTQDLAAFQLAAQLGGVELDLFGKAAKFLGKSVLEYVSKGTGEAADAFEMLGITAETLKPIMNDSVAVMGLVADKLALMENGAVKNALAQELLGGRAVALLPALEGGTKAMEAYRKESVLLGTSMDKETVEGVEAANDAITRLTTMFKGLTQQTVAALAPGLQQLVDVFRNMVLDAAKAEGGIAGLGKAIALNLIGALKTVLKAVFKFSVTANDIIYSMPFLKTPPTITFDPTPAYAALTALEDRVAKGFAASKDGEDGGGGSALVTAVMGTEEEWMQNMDSQQRMMADHMGTLSKIQKGAANDSTAFEKASGKNKTKMVLGELTTMTAGVATQNKKMFAINKVASLSSAIVNTYEGITKTLAKYPGPLGVGLSIAHGLAGFAAVKSIASSSFGGGGGGSAGGGRGGGASPTYNASPTTGMPVEEPRRAPTQVSVTFEGITDKNGLRKLAEQLNEVYQDGYLLEVS